MSIIKGYLTKNGKIMSKEKVAQKGDKKKPEKNLKEKRADKKEKRDIKLQGS